MNNYYFYFVEIVIDGYSFVSLVVFLFLNAKT